MSSEAKHTPGPWNIRDARGLLMGQSESAGSPLRDPEVEANARLIAAAPDLLAALKTCLHYLPAQSRSVYKAAHVAAHEKALAAIAKAEGR